MSVLTATRPHRVGHKGADHLAPGNTAASFDAALLEGVDMIEFDVLPEHVDGTGELFLAHDYTALGPDVLTLREGLDHLAGPAFAGVDFDVDLKLMGYERRVLEALAERGLLDRTLISTMEIDSLHVVRAAFPDVRLGWSVPKVRRDYLANPVTRVIAIAFATPGRLVIARRCARRIRAGEFDAVMSHWALVTPLFARTIARAGGQLYVWTVDDAERIAALEAMPGVTGVITNDPRLFSG